MLLLRTLLKHFNFSSPALIFEKLNLHRRTFRFVDLSLFMGSFETFLVLRDMKSGIKGIIKKEDILSF